MKIIIDKRYRWNFESMDDIRIWYVGEKSAVWQIVDLWKQDPNVPPKELEDRLSGVGGNYAAIIEQEEKVLGVVDKIRSYPVFYFHQGSEFAISNSARRLKEDLNLNEIDDMSLLEFRMAGYVTGINTHYKDLFQLQAGEFVLWDQKLGRLYRESYYRYLPAAIRSDSEENLIEELTALTDRIFQALAERANGRPIWVPLSGGLDSRLVLCKLKELGYEKLTAFSYGPPGNYEAKAARHVAAKLQVPWLFVPTRHRNYRKFFRSAVRKEYWAFCDGLSVVPNMQDIEPMIYLQKKGVLLQGSVIVNGQSGDFITGGHIPQALLQKEPSVVNLLDSIVDKHFSLWVNLKTVEHISRIKKKMTALLGVKEQDVLDKEDVIALYECWEWRERQCKYVINGQRTYDFLGFSWELPLWDDRYLRFWERVPLTQRSRQRLYRRYLNRYDFNGLFRGFSPTIWRWPGVSLGIVGLARMFQIILGSEWKERLYKYSSYFGHYGPQFAPYCLKEYVKNIRKARNSVAFYAETWLQENGFLTEATPG